MLVAVMPFQGVAESPGSGLIVADIMANELYALGCYTVVTPEVVAARAASREGEILSPEETGMLVGAPMILTGRVTEYTYKSGVGEQPAVGVTARLLESATGRVLWSGSRAHTGSAGWLHGDSLSILASRICHSLVKSLSGEALDYGWGRPDNEYSIEKYPPAAGGRKVAPDKPYSTRARAAAGPNGAKSFPAGPPGTPNGRRTGSGREDKSSYLFVPRPK
ncbi:MAG: CsgG/HfaB family protein [Planctomycetota bacterium]|nr:CsgG/HfaB family protein [Planctomycetota bacterium]